MAIEQGVIKEQVSGMMEQLRRVGTPYRQRALCPESLPYYRGRFRPRDGSLGKRVKKIGDAIDKLGGQFSKLLGTHGQRCRAILKALIVGHRKPQPNSIRRMRKFIAVLYSTGGDRIGRTGSSGTFDFTLNFVADGGGCSDGVCAATDSQPEQSGPSLAEAMKEQLGLNLVPTKAPSDFIVLDKIDYPSEN